MALEKLKISFNFLRWVPTLVKASPSSSSTAGDLIEAAAVKYADQSMIEFDGRELNFAEFNARANQIAHWALAQGFGKGDVVALLMENRPEFIMVWAGLAKIGVTTALLNCNLEGKALAHVVTAANSKALIAGSECLPSWLALADMPDVDMPSDLPGFVMPEQVGQELTLAEGFSNLAEASCNQPTDNPDKSIRADLTGADPLFYIYTSGTTGLPKAAKYSHSRFWGSGSYHLFSGCNKDDAIYCTLPLYHTVGGVICVNAIFHTGAKLILRRKFSARSFWQDVTESGATSFQYIGELCRYLVTQAPGEYDKKHSLRYCVGNGMRPDVWVEFEQRFGRTAGGKRLPKVVEFYGATESNVSLVNLEGRTGSIGKPVVGMKTRLVKFDVEADDLVRDRNGFCVDCELGEPGEMLGYIRENSVVGGFEGYTSKEATAKKIAKDVSKKGDSWFRTGDLLRKDKDGFYYFVDRIGDTFRWKGENVSTQEVAEAASLDESVEIAIVYGVEVPNTDGRAGMASLILKEGQVFDPAVFYKAVSSLPVYARPAFVRIEQAVEMTGTMKVRKVDLQNEGYSPELISGPLFYRNDKSESFDALDHEAFAKINAGELRL